MADEIKLNWVNCIYRTHINSFNICNERTDSVGFLAINFVMKKVQIDKYSVLTFRMYKAG